MIKCLRVNVLFQLTGVATDGGDRATTVSITINVTRNGDCPSFRSDLPTEYVVEERNRIIDIVKLSDYVVDTDPAVSTIPSTLYLLSNSYTMGCPPVRGDNPRALASGLSYVQVDKHSITILYHLHQCRPCTSCDISC